MSIPSRSGITVSTFTLAFLLIASNATAQDPLANAPLARESAQKANSSEKGVTSTPGTVSKADTKSKASASASAKPEFIVKSPAEWRKILTKTQFAVARESMTEPAFTGHYASGHFHGTFVCVCCEAAHVQSELFSSQSKFDSGTGWPSFFRAYNNKSLRTAWDYNDVEPRVEVMCRRCGAHLGHVFDDGPPPTGLRFCINSASIKLVSPEGEASSRSVRKKPATRARSRAKARSGVKSTTPAASAGESSKSQGSQAGSPADKPATDSSSGPGR